MKRKPFPVISPKGGLDVSLDAVFLTNITSPNLDVVRFDKGLLKKDLGFRQFEDDADERPMLLATYYQYDGTTFTILCTVDHAYKLAADTWTLISTSPGPSFTGDEDDIFWSVIFNDLFIVTNGTDNIMKWEGTTWADLGGATGNYKAKCMAPFYSTLVLGHTIESGTACPYRIRWSDTGDPENWSTGNAGFVDLMDTADFITALVQMGDRLFVFKERSIWELIFVGDTGSAMFEPRLVIDGIGTYAGKTCINLGTKILFFGSDSIYSFDGLHIDSVSDQLFPILYETGEKIVQHNKLNRAVAEYVEETGDYIVALPTGNDNPDLLLRYNVKDKSWAKRTKDVVALGLYSSQTQITWAVAKTGALAWNHADWAIPWKRQQLLSGSPTMLYLASDNTIEEDDRTVYSSELMIWETKDFILAEACRWLYVVFETRGESYDVSHSFDQGRSWSDEETLTPDADDFRKMVYPINATHKQIRLRIRTYNEKFELKWLTPYYIPRSRSKELFQ